MGSPSFPDMVANEKGWGPLLVDKASNKIRRDLFHGQTVVDGTLYGGTRALVNQVASMMEDWDFKFERPKIDGHRAFKLVNPDHVPVTKGHKKKGPSRVSRKMREAAAALAHSNGSDNGSRRGHHGDLRAALRDALLGGEALSDKDAQAKYGGGNGNLRRVVDMLRAEGCTFDEYKGSNGKTFVLKRLGKGMGNAVAKPNGYESHRPGSNNRLPVLAFAPGEHVQMEAPPVPTFGSHIFVAGTYMARDGSVSVVLRDEHTDWMANIEGIEESAEANL